MMGLIGEDVLTWPSETDEIGDAVQLLTDNSSIEALLLALGIDPSHHISRQPSALEQKRSGTPKKAYSVASEPRFSEAVQGIVESAFDATSDPRVAECRALLLKDIEPYG
jgi:hypothetical protein